MSSQTGALITRTRHRKKTKMRKVGGKRRGLPLRSSCRSWPWNGRPVVCGICTSCVRLFVLFCSWCFKALTFELVSALASAFILSEAIVKPCMAIHSNLPPRRTLSKDRLNFYINSQIDPRIGSAGQSEVKFVAFQLYNLHLFSSQNLFEKAHVRVL